jgi:hypothetical protein
MYTGLTTTHTTIPLVYPSRVTRHASLRSHRHIFIFHLQCVLLLVGSLPCRNPKCETLKNVPAIHDMCVGPPTTVFLPIICCWQTLFGKSWVMDQTTSRSCFQGSIKKNSPHAPLLNLGVRWKRYRASAVCSPVRNPRADFFLKRGFGENIDFGPFFQF